MKLQPLILTSLLLFSQLIFADSYLGMSPPSMVGVMNWPSTYNVGNFPTVYPVTGVFWQSVQPVSGTFWQSVQPVSGTFWQSVQPVSGTFWQSVQPVSGPLTNTELRAAPVPVTPSVTTSSSAVVTSTNVLLVSVQIAASNPNRKGFYIWNNSSNSTYISLSATSNSSTPTRLIPTFATWEVNTGTIWTGPISAIRNAGSGQVTVYELQ